MKLILSKEKKTEGEERWPKSEIRNSKSETNSNDGNSNVPNLGGVLVLVISPWDFEFVSDFGFRISSFKPSTASA